MGKYKPLSKRFSKEEIEKYGDLIEIFEEISKTHKVKSTDKELLQMAKIAIQKKEEERKKKVHEKVRFECLGNDLFWDCCFWKENEWFHCSWTGYDDDYWWNNVAPTKKIQTVTGNNGTKVTVEIDFHTFEVKEI